MGLIPGINMMMRIHPTILIFLMARATLLAQPDFTADTLEGCDQLAVVFTLDTNTVDTDTISSADWRFGNQTGSTAMQPDTVIYRVQDSTRQFDVSLFLNNDSVNGIVKEAYITVHKSYNPRFIMQELNELNVQFSAVQQEWTDPNTNYTFQWNISDGTVVNNANQTYVHEFTDTGNHSVSLSVEDDNGCSSQFDTSFVLTEKYDFPNILNTAINDYILYEYDANNPVRFQVFSRTGVKVYESYAPSIYWDGRNFSGDYLNSGIYFYLIESEQQSNTFQHKGFIYIISE